MRTSVSSALIAALLAWPAAAEKVPLHWYWHATENDSAYAADAATAAALRARGFADQGPVAAVEAAPSRDNLPLMCMHAGAPRTNTFCSPSAMERALVRRLGYVPAGQAGFVRRDRAPGTVPLFRLSKSHGDGRDREHRLVTHEAEVRRLRALLWTYDGAKGYVFPAPAPAATLPAP